jgi:subtilisin family serine protease
MSGLRRTRYVTTATALVVGSCLGVPAAAASATVLADPGSTCTVSSVSPAADQTDPPWEIAAADPGSLTDLNGDQLTGSGVTVAVIDTGVGDPSQLTVHSGEVLNGESGTAATDDDGHGTMVASIIAAKKSSANGMQGIAPGVTLMSIREAGCKATAGNDENTMARAVNDAVEDGADVINISQDGYDPDSSLLGAVENAYDKGVVVVTSAGNQGDRDTTDNNGTDYGVDPRTYPASYRPYVLAVGAVDQSGDVAPFSETGSQRATYYIGVTAPGVSVGGLVPAGTIDIDDGTSFAAPYVAAEAALIMQEYGWAVDDPANEVSARAYDVMKIIYATASGDGSYDPALGWGEADIQKALQTPVTGPGGGPLGAPSRPIGGLVTLKGQGPLADVPAAAAANPAGRAVVKPYAAAAVNQEAKNQQRWAYLGLGIGVLVAFVALAARAVARDAARRRNGSRR